MANSPINKPDQEQVSPHISPSAIALEELRRLLLAPEQAQLGHLRERLDRLKVEAPEVALVLAEAIRSRSQESKDLKESLAPIIQDEFNDEFPVAFRRSVAEDPTAIAEAVSPILGPTLSNEFEKKFPVTFLRAVEENPAALAKAVSPILMPAIKQWVLDKIDDVVHTIHQSKIGELVQIVNQALEHETPIQRLNWRIQALRSGRTYEEVRSAYLLARFKVMHVFLMHTRTGILLNRVSARSEDELREDVMSSMLAGIKKAVEDWSKKADPSSDGLLKLLDLGSNKIFIEMGAYALLAVVVKKTPPPGWENNLHEIRREIHEEFEAKLENFQGNMEGFEQTTPLLEKVLVSSTQHQSEGTKKEKNSKKWLVITGAILLVMLLFGWAGHSLYKGYIWDSFVELVGEAEKAETGLFITSVEQDGGDRIVVQGFREPTLHNKTLENLFKRISNEAGVEYESLDLNITPFFPLSPEYIERLAIALLSPPDSVRLSVTDEGALRAIGVASSEWIKEFHARAEFLPGIASVKGEELEDRNISELVQIKKAIESFQMVFDQGSTGLSPSAISQIEVLTQDIQRLEDIAHSAGKTFTVEIHGHSSQEGSERINKQISLHRAQGLLAALRLNGLANVRFRAIAKGSEVPHRVGSDEEDYSENRRVSLHVLGQDPEKTQGGNAD